MFTVTVPDTYLGGARWLHGTLADVLPELLDIIEYEEVPVYERFEGHCNLLAREYWQWRQLVARSPEHEDVYTRQFYAAVWKREQEVVKAIRSVLKWKVKPPRRDDLKETADALRSPPWTLLRMYHLEFVGDE